MSDNNDTGHDYDGIRENDNPMPTWWLGTFFITIIFGAMYFLHYASGTGDDSFVEFEKAFAHHKNMFKVKNKHSKKNAASFNEKMEIYANSEIAQTTYQRVCQACHNDSLQGLIGPNLIDAFWIHGEGRPEDIFNTIEVGVLDKGMPAWGEILKEEELYALTAYIIANRGRNVSNAKAAEGQEYPQYLK